MPPLPVVRAQLLGVLQAPAGKLVRTIAEPAAWSGGCRQGFRRESRSECRGVIGLIHYAITIKIYLVSKEYLYNG
jgi:hypothetical protein